MFFYIFIIFQIFNSVSGLISCYNCPFDENSFNYLVTVDNFPSELRNCSIESNANKCYIEVMWGRHPDNTKITLVGGEDISPGTNDHALMINVGYENQRSTLTWEKVLTYECATDQCNSLSEFKRVLNSLIMNDSLSELTYLLNPQKPFQGEWCSFFSNATFEKCDTTIPVGSCAQCTLAGMINETGAELCATCSTDGDDRNVLAHGKTYNLTDRTESTNLLMICERESCNAPSIGNDIQANSYIYFDFNKFFDITTTTTDTVSTTTITDIVSTTTTTNIVSTTSTSKSPCLSLMNKITLFFIIFFLMI